MKTCAFFHTLSNDWLNCTQLGRHKQSSTPEDTLVPQATLYKFINESVVPMYFKISPRLTWNTDLEYILDVSAVNQMSL